ncbi:16S rRNA (guanine(527)-N(7))-methyltransferase RsmG [Sulfurimonas paralvinellae]|uniref:Ribosomal RNA small subunit methyltransferase G n=1 Tax=Sulfurimonas paralvinellae TaxID=317658 RepID=A0A7M1B5M9_9BACT|nr:16S rRNA (guanine(527)-N(7))-methyltransferase RsmG [Sulfurimonas paralvinellae]QOP45034.1 16S rRNA (guanine(527)-N(7))-methyltransferase RsmG [Sulfurimonas paralvinellae]
MQLHRRIEETGIKVPDTFFANIEKYKANLLKWNRVHNLTGARDEATLDEFIFDALYPVSFLPQVSSLLDIGTGAGFPGMILAFALPETEVTLVEPLTKRASFLQFIKADLGLENVRVIKKRVEEMQPETFELITSRAVTDTKMLLELSKDYRDENSKLLFYKGEKVFDEVEETQNMPHKIIERQNRHYLLLGEGL